MELVTPRQINFGLWTATVLISAGTVAALIVGTRTTAVDPEGDVFATSTVHSASRAQDDLERYEPIWSRSLRGFDAVAVQTTQPIAQPASAVATTEPIAMPLTLVGTVGHSLALLRTSDGVVEVRGVGEKFAGAEVVSVEPSRVQVRFNGKVVTLTKPRPAGDL
jgi:hypothetical protein